jgi:hypothetical protein
VPASDVQYCVAQWPGVPAWPITAPTVPIIVIDVGRKLAGTAPPDAVVDSAVPGGISVADLDAVAPGR